MLVEMGRDEVPTRRQHAIGKTRAFANDSLEMFMECGAEAAKVTGLPEGYKAVALAQALREQIHKVGASKQVEVATRRGVVYLIRKDM